MSDSFKRAFKAGVSRQIAFFPNDLGLPLSSFLKRSSSVTPFGSAARLANFKESEPAKGVYWPDWRSQLVFLPSEAATVGLVFWVLDRLFNVGSPWAKGSLLEVLAWCAIGGISVALERWRMRSLVGLHRALTFALGLVTAVWVAKIAGPLTWTQAGGMAFVLAFTLTAIRRLRGLSLPQGPLEAAEGLRWAVLQLAAVGALHLYVRAAFVGAGDAYNYGLTLADFTGQMHAGIFPIFVGQTQFAFNGNIHPLRTAPYFAHLGGFLDLLTLRTLPPYALVNLAIVGSAGLGATGTYAALRVYSSKLPWVAVGLAVLYLLSPAFLALVYEGDMIATYMTFPMIPWLVLGIGLAAERPDEVRPWLLQAAALAALWWTHPPIAFWASVLCASAGAAILITAGVTMSRLALMAVAATLFAILAAYEFTSVFTLNLPRGTETQAGEAWTVLGNIHHYWAQGFLPMSRKADSLLGDVQLGYSLFFCAAGGLLISARRKAAGVLFFCFLFILLFLLPVPGLTGWLWSHVPRAVLDFTNAWPMQRLYPILAGIAVFAAWSGLSEFKARGRSAKIGLGLLLLGCCAWSAAEERKLLHHALMMQRSPEQSASLYAPGNIALTRVSYMFFGHRPAYFSDGPMQPILETRLLDARTLDVVGDGTSRLGRVPILRGKADMKGLSYGVAELKIPMRPWEASVLRFDFLGRQPVGELQVTSHSMFGLYRLPSAGDLKSFGAGPENSRAIEIRNDSEADDTVVLTFVPDSSHGEGVARGAEFAHISLESGLATGREIELVSLLPFQAVVRADHEAILETPKMDIPGYRASVNGRIVETVRTAEGLVGVPVHPGTSDVRLEYPGVPALRWTYGISGFSWLAIMAAAALTRYPFRGRGLRTLLSRIETNAHGYFRVALAGGLAAALVIGGPLLWRRWIAPEGATRRLIVILPLGDAGQSEPLVETGRAGAADVIYVRFLGGNRVTVGYDKWSLRASESAPFEVDFTRPQAIEVKMRSLARGAWWERRPPAASGVTVKWNGREVLTVKGDPYPRGLSAVEIGSNRVGATSCSASFSGKILSVASVDERIR